MALAVVSALMWSGQVLAFEPPTQDGQEAYAVLERHGLTTHEQMIRALAHADPVIRDAATRWLTYEGFDVVRVATIAEEPLLNRGIAALLEEDVQPSKAALQQVIDAHQRLAGAPAQSEDAHAQDDMVAASRDASRLLRDARDGLDRWELHRYRLLQVIEEVGDDVAVPALVDLLQYEPTEANQFKALSVLASLRALPQATRAFQQKLAMRDPSSGVPYVAQWHRLAMQGLGFQALMIPDDRPGLVAQLKAEANDTADADVKATVADTLVMLREPFGVELWIELLEHPRYHDRAAKELDRLSSTRTSAHDTQTWRAWWAQRQAGFVFPDVLRSRALEWLPAWDVEGPDEAWIQRIINLP